MTEQDQSELEMQTIRSEPLLPGNSSYDSNIGYSLQLDEADQALKMKLVMPLSWDSGICWINIIDINRYQLSIDSGNSESKSAELTQLVCSARTLSAARLFSTSCSPKSMLSKSSKLQNHHTQSDTGHVLPYVCCGISGCESESPFQIHLREAQLHLRAQASFKPPKDKLKQPVMHAGQMDGAQRPSFLSNRVIIAELTSSLIERFPGLRPESDVVSLKL